MSAHRDEAPAGFEPFPPSDWYEVPMIVNLNKLIGVKLHCYLSVAFVAVYIGFYQFFVLVKRLLGLHLPPEDYRGLTGFLPFYMKWVYGAVCDCWNRPIRGPPSKWTEVIQRTRYRDGRVYVTLVPDFKGPTLRCLNLGSYNYLGYGGIDDYVLPRTIEALHRTGVSVSTTPAELGICPEQREAEIMLAKFIGKEDAVSFPMGFATNSLVIPALGGKGTLVISDALNHASIVTGVRVSGSTVRVNRHNDMAHLEELLKTATAEKGPYNGKRWKRILVIAEGLYSMEGELCPLPELVKIKSRYGAMLYVDEAHSIGAIGPHGKGVCDYYGVPPAMVDVLMGTFTKSFSSIGGYIASDAATVAYLRQYALGTIYGTSMSPSCAQQIVSALEHIQTEEGMKKIRQLKENSILFRKRLVEHGCQLLGPPDTPVVPLMVRHPGKLPIFSRRLLKEHIATVIVGFPATDLLGLRSRFCVCAALTEQEIEDAAAKIGKVAKDLHVDFVPKAEVAKAIKENEEWLAKHSKLDPVIVGEPAVDFKSESVVPAGFKPKPIRICDPAKQPQIVLSSYDFLGLANAPEIKKASEETMRVYGVGACGPRGFYGTTEKHLDLERRINKFIGSECTIAYSYGTLTPTSVIPPYANEASDIIFHDSAINYSCQLGVFLSKGMAFEFPHNDIEALEHMLEGVAACKELKKARKFIVTEGLFANSGDVCNLPGIARLREKFGCMLIVDETLSIGALGATGRGVREHWVEKTGDKTLMSCIDLLVGSLETSLGSIGGFCCGRRGLIQYQNLAGIGYVFSASAAPYLCTAGVAAVDLLDTEESKERTTRLHENARAVRAAARDILGAEFDISGSEEADADASPMFLLSLRRRGARWPAYEDDEAVLEAVSNGLLEQGKVGVAVARFTGPDKSRPARPALRVCVSSKYPVDAYVDAFKAIREATLAHLK